MDNIEDLQEALEDILPAGFLIEMDEDGQLVIYTGLTQDEDGELSPLEEDEDHFDDED